ncbi:MAG TPA: formimidoylglutamate deiminase, partial [Bryobacteraceae bacterium]|nr:formimidoylglutamate deiminase [Bryobacteraceae bacterium]
MNHGWLPDFVYTGGRFESGVAQVIDESGLVRYSREAEDLERATRLPNRAMLPGLVNVHSHTFQRMIRGRTEFRTSSHRDTFWTWRESMYRAANSVTPEMVYRAARMAFLEMALSGITAVGEFHYLHHGPRGVPYENRNLLALLILRAAEEVGIRIALLRTAYVRAGWKKDPDPGQIRFITPNVDDFLRDCDDLAAAIARGHNLASMGVAPHSIRAVPMEYLREVAKYARVHHLPLHMHLAEQPAEVEASIGEYGKRPVELLHDEGLLDLHFTAIHAIHITPAEARALGEGRANVCACPTSERNLGDGAVPADQLMNAGAKLCFGSDSNIQIDVLEDARELEYHLRMNQLERVILAEDDSLARRLFTSATESGAASLNSRGPDFFTVDLNDPSLAGATQESLLDHIVFSLERTAIRDVFVDGRQIVSDGEHPLQ